VYDAKHAAVSGHQAAEGKGAQQADGKIAKNWGKITMSKLSGVSDSTSNSRKNMKLKLRLRR